MFKLHKACGGKFFPSLYICLQKKTLTLLSHKVLIKKDYNYDVTNYFSIDRHKFDVLHPPEKSRKRDG